MKIVDKYVHPTEQLVTEIVVRDIRRSVGFYGLRDFMIADPDGFGVRFATELRTPLTRRLRTEV